MSSPGCKLVLFKISFLSLWLLTCTVSISLDLLSFKSDFEFHFSKSSIVCCNNAYSSGKISGSNSPLVTLYSTLNGSLTSTSAFLLNDSSYFFLNSSSCLFRSSINLWVYVGTSTLANVMTSSGPFLASTSCIVFGTLDGSGILI